MGTGSQIIWYDTYTNTIFIHTFVLEDYKVCILAAAAATGGAVESGKASRASIGYSDLFKPNTGVRNTLISRTSPTYRRAALNGNRFICK